VEGLLTQSYTEIVENSAVRPHKNRPTEIILQAFNDLFLNMAFITDQPIRYFSPLSNLQLGYYPSWACQRIFISLWFLNLLFLHENERTESD
jgi:hypothetical protein